MSGLPSDATPSWKRSMELLDRLPALPVAERAGLLERLIRDPSPGIRERALQVGVAVLPEATLIDYLRDESDAVVRNAALEILKERGGRSFRLAVDLLRDRDPDVALQAVLILDHIKDPRAFEPLREMLSHSNPNVVQAAIQAIGHLGDARAISDLLPFLRADPWLQAAAVQALGELRSAAAVGPLSKLLTDLMTGPMATEAIAQIGGARAFAVLARHWLRFQEELDSETTLGLLAHVLEGLRRAPQPLEGLRQSFALRLRDPFREVRVSAARCLLALGPGAEDGEALGALAQARREPEILPGCLSRRKDLIGLLLAKPRLFRSWGFLLAARHPRAVRAEELAMAVREEILHLPLGPVVEALRRRGEPVLADALLDLFLRLPAEERGPLAPLLRRHHARLAEALERRPDASGVDRVVVAAALGRSAAELRAALLELSPEARAEAISQLADRPELAASLPWSGWLSEDPERYADLAGQVAVSAGLRELLPELRRLLAAAPRVSCLRAVGELGDRESVPLLIELLGSEESLLRSVAIESLGRIGGPQARRELRRLAAEGEGLISRLAYGALAACATEEDDAFFRRVIGHPDWFVRKACADVLGRFARAENRTALSQLAADPVPFVARRARGFLEG